MSHEPIIINSLTAEYQIPVVHKACQVRYLILGALIVGLAVGAILF